MTTDTDRGASLAQEEKVPPRLKMRYREEIRDALQSQFNYANVIAIPLLLGVGVDSGIHVVHRARALGAQENPADSSTGRAVVFSALTTATSFGNLALSSHPGTASMGVVLTLGLLLILLATLVLLPALLARPRSEEEARP